MSREERFHGSIRAVGCSPSGRSSSGSSRVYGPGAPLRRQHQLQQQRSVPANRKPPEPLRRAVADCLSSSAPHLHGNPSALSSEAGRTLRDYLASPATTDMAYSVLLEHTLAERDRRSLSWIHEARRTIIWISDSSNPAIVSRCVALLKLYLLRYVPKVQTLQQIDVFCANSIAECHSVANRGMPSWSSSLSPHPGPSTTSGNTVLPSLPASTYASASLVKSLNYVRSLVVRHIPKLSFPPVVFSGASSTLRQSLPTLSSLLSRSFNSQLSPEAVNSQEPSEIKEDSSPSTLNLSSVEKIDGIENNKYIFVDLFKWRWHGDRERQLSSATNESGVMRPQDVRALDFLEVGAAALLVGDVEARMKGHSSKRSDATDLPDIGQLLQPSTITTATSFTSAHNHLKAITASKRLKPGPHQVWMNVPVSTFHPRARTLFQYRHYSEQQPLRLNPAEVCDVIAAVCLEPSPPNSNFTTTSLQLSNPGGKPSTDAAVSVLIKLIIDMYMMDSETAAPFTLFMLEDMLSSSKVSSRVRVFDIILNLGVHAHLLEPMFTEDPTSVEEPSQDSQQRVSSATDNFESWLFVILYEILLHLVQTEEREEIVWASALSCLLYFICDKGEILRKRLEGLDIRVIKAFLDISREHSWAEIVHCKLICILANMFYQVSDPTNANSETPVFLAERVHLLGGIDFICLEYARANLREEKQDLFLVLFDYVLDQINESSLANGGLTYSSDEIQPLATMLTLADAPEAFYIAVKHGVEGIGEILRRSISSALSRSSNYDRLNLLLEKITRNLDVTISSFTRPDSEFLYMIRITKSYKFLNSIDDGLAENDVATKVRLSWATLHSLLHSERSTYRHNGYIWLVELLLSGISAEGDANILSNIKKLQQQITLAGSQDLNCLSVPIPVSILCGLLKSKHGIIRWGFLFVLEKLLMRCKLLLDENKLQHTKNGDAIGYDKSDSSLEKATAVTDLMSCGLALLFQINETDLIIILKMCDMLFSQLSMRLFPANRISIGDLGCSSNLFGCTIESSKTDVGMYVLQHKENGSKDESRKSVNITVGIDQPPHICESASMAALLLQGYAIVPMQLVARVPTSVLYWPLIQLAGAATDDIALGVAVGSKGRGNLPGASSDVRAALLLLLNCKCTADPSSFLEVGGKDFFRELLDDTDSRVAYYSSAFLLKRMMTEESEKYQRLLQNLVFKAQQSDNEKLLENPYLQMRGILQLLSDLGAQL